MLSPTRASPTVRLARSGGGVAGAAAGACLSNSFFSTMMSKAPRTITRVRVTGPIKRGLLSARLFAGLLAGRRNSYGDAGRLQLALAFKGGELVVDTVASQGGELLL